VFEMEAVKGAAVTTELLLRSRVEGEAPRTPDSHPHTPHKVPRIEILVGAGKTR
jgi:hypothetical protein